MHIYRMITLSALLCILMLSVSPIGVSALDKSATDIDSVVDSNNRFGLDLYKNMTNSNSKDNLIFSPYSILTALSMAYAGADGQTASQMADVLRFELPPQRLFPSLLGLMDRLDKPIGSYELTVANALWGQKGFGFSPGFIDILDRFYDSGFKTVDFASLQGREDARLTINDWVEQKTNKRIKDLIGDGDLTELTRLVLTNAIYFKGTWFSQFDPEETRQMPFYPQDGQAVDVNMMHQTANCGYYEDGQVQLIEMKYKDSTVVMDIVLPKADADSADFESGLSMSKIDDMMSGLSYQRIDIYIPRFTFEKEFELSDMLKNLGMVDAFNDSDADFSGISDKDKLYISKVLHKAFIEVNEEGTEAAAATAVIMGLRGIMMEEPTVFLADHPFTFFIRDSLTGTILFIGKVNKPNS